MYARALIAAVAALLHTHTAHALRAHGTPARRLSWSASALHASAATTTLAVPSANECRKLVSSGGAKAQDLVRQSLQRIHALNGALGAFLCVSGESALQAAQRVDDDRQSLEQLPLLGVPVAIKDNLCTKDFRTTAASCVLEGYVPSYDATTVKKLLQAGAICVGKTNLDEFAMGSTTESSGYQCTLNPWGERCSPGGSSGGSAVAVASGMVATALGTDTGGSIRQPASWCGVVGLKPTYGRVSRYGLIAYGSSTDCVGPITHSVQDAAIMLQVIAGADPADPSSVCAPVADYIGAVHGMHTTLAGGTSTPLKGLRVGLIKETLEQRVQVEVSDAVKAATAHLQCLGAEVIEMSLPMLEQQTAAYYIKVMSEASANLARFDGVRYGSRDREASTSSTMMGRTRRLGIGQEVKQRILLGTFALSAGYYEAYYGKAEAMINTLKDDFDLAFKTVDVFVCPTAPTVAYKIGEYESKGSGVYADDLFTVPASLAGLPALSVPCGLSSAGLPIGLQIIGKPFDEGTLLSTGHAFERTTDWAGKMLRQ